MTNNFKKGFHGDYGVKLTPNKLKVLCEVDWPAFGVGGPPEKSLDKILINEVYKVIEKSPNTQENGKSQEAETGFQKPDFVVYLNSGTNLLGGLRRNQSSSLDG
jgi:hypothetical protein